MTEILTRDNFKAGLDLASDYTNRLNIGTAGYIFDSGSVLQIEGGADKEVQLASYDAQGNTFINMVNGTIRLSTDVLLDIQAALTQMVGPLIASQSYASKSGFRIPHGTVPTTPVDGDIWTTTAGMYARINGATVGPFGAGGGGGLDQATADGLYVNVGGDTMTNALYITRAAGSSSAIVMFQTGSVNRWGIGRDWNTESTGNQGSGFVIGRYNDAGVFIDTPLFIDRATGLITVLGNPTAALGVAPKQYVDLRVLKTGDIMTGDLTMNVAAGDHGININSPNASGDSPTIFWKKADRGYWQTYVSSAAAGDFSIGRYDDAGVWIGASLTILRASGEVRVTADPTTALGVTTKQYVDLKAPLASPTFTGTPLSTTAAVDTNTTQIATTAYVVGQGYLKTATAASTYLGNSGLQTITGAASLSLTSTGTASIILSRGGTSNYAHFEFRTAGVQKWTAGTRNGEAEDWSLFNAVTSQRPIRVDAATDLITLRGDPTAALHAATKQYVDARTPKITVATTSPTVGNVVGDLWVNST